MQIEFSGEIWTWRGPAPYHFVTVPADQSDELKAITGSWPTRSQEFEVFTNDSVSGNNIGIEVDSGATGSVFTGTSVFGNTLQGFMISDGNNTSASLMHLYGNSPDFWASGTGTTVSLSGVVFDEDAGDMQNYTNLSLSDVMDSSYTIDHADDPGSVPNANYVPFAGKFVNITNLTPTSIDSMTWHWRDS